MRQFQKSMVAILLLVVVFLASCSEERKESEHANVIPQNASAVCAFNLTDLCDKAKLNDDRYTSLKESLIQEIEKEVNSEVVIDMLRDMILKQEILGLNTAVDSYIFITKDGVLGLVAAVKDKEDICEAFPEINKENRFTVQEEAGVFKARADKMDFFVSDKTLLITTTVNYALRAEEGKKLYELTQQMFEQTKENSAVALDRFQRMAKQEGDVKMYMNYGMFLNADLPGMDQIRLQAQLLEAYDIDNLNFVAAINFEKGKAEMSVEVLPESQKSKDAVNKEMNLLMGTVNGTFSSSLPASVPLTLVTSLKGEGVYDYLLKMPNMDKVVQNLQGVDLKKMLSSFEGDFSLSLVSISQMPIITLFAEAKNMDFLDGIISLMKSNKMNPQNVGENKYALNMNGASIFIGQEKGIFYLTNDANVSADATQKIDSSFADTAYGEKAEGKNAYFLLNVEELAKNPLVMMALGQLPGATDIITKFKAFETEGKGLKSKAKLTLVDKDVNPLALFVELAVKSAKF